MSYHSLTDRSTVAELEDVKGQLSALTLQLGDLQLSHATDSDKHAKQVLCSVVWLDLTHNVERLYTFSSTTTHLRSRKMI